MGLGEGDGGFGLGEGDGGVGLGEGDGGVGLGEGDGGVGGFGPVHLQSFAGQLGGTWLQLL